MNTKYRYLFKVGFDLGDGKFNNIGSSWTIEGARNLAQEVEEEYGEYPKILKVFAKSGKFVSEVT